MIIAIVLLSVSLMIACLFLFLMYKKYNALNLDITKILIVIKRARYGDINLRLSNLKNKELETTINRLIETMYDRELMIKEYQTTLSNKNLSLEEILKQEKQIRMVKEEFAATLTHDMKVPVIAELNSINFLLDGRFGDLNEKQIQVLNLMKASNQELKDLIENILEAYRADENKIIIEKSNVNLNEYLSSIIFEMQPIALKSNHSITLKNYTETNTLINLDDFQIKRVLKNLIQNAISFSPASSDIKITVENINDCICIKVTNEGSCITEEELDLIFNKYYSGNSKYRKTSTGLGLYLSKQIINLHNGNIEVDNSKAGYTTFSIKLPLSN